MKKFLPIIIILAIIIVGAGAYVLVSGGKTPSLKEGIPGVSKVTESFSGTLKMAVEKGIPMQCSYKIDENNFGTGYIKGKKYLGEVTVQGQKSKILLLDNCIYTWNETAKQALGSKICFEPKNNESIWDQQGENKNNYTCSPVVVSDAIFSIPTDVKFMDVGQPVITGQ